MRRTAFALIALAAAAVTVLTAVNTALLVEIRDDTDAAADAIVGRDGILAKGVWVAVHSDREPRPAEPAPTTTVAAATTTTTAAAATTTQRTTTTRPPTTTTAAASRMVIEDFYLASDGETYFVEVSGVMGAAYCEAHLVGTDGRRTGEWSNELLTGSQDTVTISLWDYDRTARVDGVEVECTS